MPPRHAYWTILVGDSPTAFRAADRADLLPTFERLRQKHPEVILKWFARGRLWDSPEAQRTAERGPVASTGRERRGPEWRPGGTHRDPRDRFKPKPRENRDRGADGDRPRRDDRPERFPRPAQARPSSDREMRSRPPKSGWQGKGRPFGSPFRKPQGKRFGRPPGNAFGKPSDKTFSKPPGRPFDKAQGRPFGKAQGKPFGKAQGKSFGKAQGRPFRDQRSKEPMMPKEPPAPPAPRSIGERREEKARKGGTRLVKKFKP